MNLQTCSEKIADIERKLAATKDAASRRYYELCLIGWRRYLEKLNAESNRDKV